MKTKSKLKNKHKIGEKYMKWAALTCLLAVGLLIITGAAIGAPPAKLNNSSNTSINAIAFDQTGGLLASARDDGMVTLWNVSNASMISELTSSTSASVTGIAFNPDGTMLASSSSDSVARLWNIFPGQIRKELHGHGEGGAVLDVAYSPDDKIVATAGQDTKVMIWDAVSGNLKLVLVGHKNFVRSIAFGPNSTRLVSGSDDGSIKIWNTVSGHELLSIDVGSGVDSVVFNRDGSTIASGSRDGNIKEWSASTGQLVRTYNTGKGASINSLAYSPDGTALTGVANDGSIKTWRRSNGILIGNVAQGNIRVNAVAYTADSQTVASAGADGIIKLWNTKTWKLKGNLTEKSQSPKSAVFIQTNTITAPKQVANQMSPQGPGGPILIITSSGSTNPFGSYYTEILRNEGFNAFQVADISTVTLTTLSSYDIVILTEMTLDTSQVTMLSNWVTGGGRLIAMRPDPQLSGLLGITGPSGTLNGAYMLVNTTGAPGNGIVSQTIQYKGVADLYNMNGAASVASLYSDSTKAMSNPAVTLRNVGSGRAAAFTYDLAKSVLYMRQGNPTWVFQERDGFPPQRSDDLFYGAAVFDPQPDWIDLSKVTIPQADEQMRLLANMIIDMTKDIKPLPRFWYLPHGYKAAIVMTGDDHGNGGTAGRFDQYIGLSPAGCSVADWECIRSTSYIYTNTPLSNEQAISYQNQGFEIGLHENSNCADYNTQDALESLYIDQLAGWQTKYSGLNSPSTSRFHCIVWDGWTIQPSVELNHGIRFDTNYYYWPPAWLNDRPGFFTGSGMPMRFSDLNGNLVDVYHATTQMTDESGQSYPFTPDNLLDRAIGPEEYFGVFTVNAHTDTALSSVSDAVVTSALARHIPIVSSRQMLNWIDGRDNSIYNNLNWDGKTISFSITSAAGAIGLQVMVPVATSTGFSVDSVKVNGNPTNYVIKTIKGINYAFIDASTGTFAITYAQDLIPPNVVNNTPTSGAIGVNISSSATVTFNEALDASTINTNTFELHVGDASGPLVPADVSYDTSTFTATLQPSNLLTSSTNYTAIVDGVKDVAGNTMSSYNWSFTTSSGGGPTCPCSIWSEFSTPEAITVNDQSSVELGVKFNADTNGNITGIRFYKGPSNTGTHVGSLWSSTGSLLAQAPFTGETASGWQQVTFATPVPIIAGTTYIASYHTNIGYYSGDNNYFTSSGIDNTPLHALRNGVDGGNGVYNYNVNPAFPSDTWYSSNYWVDIVFEKDSTGSDIIPPTVINFTIPANYNNLTVPIINFTATDNIGVTGYMVTESQTAPSPNAGGWLTTAPTSYTFTTQGNKTLYAWAKDATGYVSTSKSATVNITLVNESVTLGWYAGDMHVHRSCGDSPRSISDMYQNMLSQNLTFMSLLADMGNGEVQDPIQDLPRVTGQDDPNSTPGHIVHWDAEWHWDPTYSQYPHQALGGHIVALGLNDAYQIWQEYTYPILNWAHQQGGIAGFAHMQYLDDNIPQNLNCCIPIEYPVEVALGSADFIDEDVTDVNNPMPGMNAEAAIHAYYRLLNDGFRPSLAAGTDYPCGNSNVGSLLTYVNIKGQPTYHNWVDGIAKGRTVVSRNGHNEFLNLTVNNNAIPGDEINLTGAGDVPVTITWTTNQPLSGTIELVSNGVVVASKQTSVTPNTPAGLSTTVNFAKSGWLAARRMGANGHYVHTGAVFVKVDNKPVRASAADAQFYVQWMDNLLQKTSPGGVWNSYFVNNLSEAQARYQAARAIYQQIALEAGGMNDSTPPVTNISLTGTLGNNSWYISNVNVTLNATDDNSGVNYTKYNINNGSWFTFTLPFLVSIAGPDNVQFYSVDMSNNIEQMRYQSIKIDKTPPGTITGIKNIHGRTYINWTWIDPTSSDTSGFAYVMVYLNGLFKNNVSKGVRYYNATGLLNATSYTISTRTVDNAGNINMKWINNTVKTS